MCGTVIGARNFSPWAPIVSTGIVLADIFKGRSQRRAAINVFVVQPGQKLLTASFGVWSNATDQGVGVVFAVDGIVVDVNGAIANPNIVWKVKEGFRNAGFGRQGPRAVIGKPVCIILFDVGGGTVQQNGGITVVLSGIAIAARGRVELHVKAFLNATDAVEANIFTQIICTIGLIKSVYPGIGVTRIRITRATIRFEGWLVGYRRVVIDFVYPTGVVVSIATITTKIVWHVTPRHGSGIVIDKHQV